MNATDPGSGNASNRILLIAGAVLLAFGVLIISMWNARMRRMASNDLIMIVANSVMVARARGETFVPPITDNAELAQLLIERHRFHPPEKRLVAGKLVDAWGHALAVSIGPERVRIASAGPDGDQTSEVDNLVFEHRIRPEAPAAMSAP